MASPENHVVSRRAGYRQLTNSRIHQLQVYTLESLCPSFSFFVFKYRLLDSDAGVSSGSHSLTDIP